MTALLWLQIGSRGGTMSLLCADSPSPEELVADYGAELLCQPSLSIKPKSQLDMLINAFIEDRQPLTCYA